MLSFLKRWLRRRGTGRSRDAEPELDLGPHARAAAMMPRMPRADVHRLMVEATALRRRKGYHEAVQFLMELAEAYLREGNTALVTTLNKLVPYIKRDEQMSYAEARRWMEQLLARLPRHDPYFLNAHITFAELLEQEGADRSIAYLEAFLRDHPPSRDTYYHLIRLADFYREVRDLAKAQEHLMEARRQWDTRLERYRLIRMMRRWHRSMALLSFARDDTGEYLFHRAMEFALDMARVLDPARIEEFHHRKDQYYKGERGFVGTTAFENVMRTSALAPRREKIIADLYGFVFEEMPLLLGVTRADLSFRPGDPETLEDVQRRKSFSSRPFLEYDQLNEKIRNIGI